MSFPLSSAVQALHNTACVSVAAATMVIYDHLCTFEKERTYIWPAKITVGKMAFFINRYLLAPSLTLYMFFFTAGTLTLSLKMCHSSIAYIVYGGATLLSICNFLILIKMGRLWGESRKVYLITLISIAIFTSVAYTVIGLVEREIHSKELLVLHRTKPPVCVFESTPRTLVVYWALSLAFDSMVCILIIVNALSRPRTCDREMVRILYRDGILIFTPITALRIFNSVVTATKKADNALLTVGLLCGIEAIIVARMIMNLEVAERKAKLDILEDDFLPLQYLPRV